MVERPLREIVFEDIGIDCDGVLRATVIRDGDNRDEFWVRLPYTFSPRADLIAIVFALIAGRAFDGITIDLPVGDRLRAAIEAYTQADLTCQSGADVRRKPGDTAALNFSGGYDSLAALAVLDAPVLISLDFGGRFARERAAFVPFSGFVFETNLVDLKLNRYGHDFMAVGSVLLRDELSISRTHYGSILGASLPSVLKGPSRGPEARERLLNEVGIQLTNPVAGVTEIGTMKIVAKTRPALFTSTLATVANPREEKFTRKGQLLAAVSEELHLGLAIPEVVPSRQPAVWGANFTTDLSSLYVMSRLGVGPVSESYAGGIPKTVAREVGDLDFTFYGRFNPHAYSFVSDEILAEWMARMVNVGIVPYERDDWAAANHVCELIRSSGMG